MKHLFDESISKQKIDKLVLEYFIHEGYKNAAIELTKELNIKIHGINEPIYKDESFKILGKRKKIQKNALQNSSYTAKYTDDQLIGDLMFQNYYTSPNDIHKYNTRQISGFSTLNQRQEIKSLILKGEISEAITKIGTYFPIILDSNNLLHFKLLRLSLIEMIRNHKFSNSMEQDERKFLNDILKFVRNNMINKISKSYKLLKELEFTMSLLCFRFDPTIKNLNEQKELPQELKNIFNLNLRHQVFRLINKEIIKIYDDDDINDNDENENNECNGFPNSNNDNGLIKDVIREIRNKDGNIEDIEDTSIKRNKLNNYEGINYHEFDFQKLNEEESYDKFIHDNIDEEEEEEENKNEYKYEIDSESIKTKEQNLMDENLIKSDIIIKNEEEIESLIKLSLESKIERILELFILTEDKLSNGNISNQLLKDMLRENRL
ncbi:uncharacterized protein KGF55_001222 [Candida pseudojiufengensis]|uniref:uncharacterized protein n=1 Tax=Candida pseudojiufengensis TaxID=497109 RepID=UPI002224953C|nr:uncharacterized protein KGF55_001222 [Candida pseudojiufengensis]KAI5965859.1 hypothetical protein KGF55_001222 [Candida pseudojiufengensis]